MYPISHSSLPDLPEIAASHAACFPESFTVRLGKACSQKSLEWFLVYDNCFLFHIKEGDTVIGYCGGFIPRFSGDGSASGMMRHTMQTALKALLSRPWLLFHTCFIKFYPLIAKNVFRKFFKSSNTNKNIHPSSTKPLQQKVGLVVIGVHPGYRGKGVFDALMKHFEKEAFARKINRLTLSVKQSNLHAIHAYKKAGWFIERESEQSVEMYKTIAPFHAV